MDALELIARYNAGERLSRQVQRKTKRGVHSMVRYGLFALCLCLLLGCAGTPAPTPTSPATQVAAQGATVISTVETPAPTPTTEAPAATAATETPAPTATPSPTPSATRTPKSTPTPSSTPSNTAPPAPTATLTPAPSPSPLPQPTPDIDLIVDNRDPAFSVTGTWFVGDGGQSYQGDCHWAPRGIQNIAYVRPELPAEGAYEVLAWWCGDPDHNQSNRVLIEIYPYPGVRVPHQVQVNLQQDAGRWNSLGTYNLGPTSSLSVDGNLEGNVVADAFRFVYRSAQPNIITPTPLPTVDPTTHYPPSPVEQLTSGDLSARLGLVQRFYPYTPIVALEETTLDDCQAFPRDGCGGTRDGWRVQVQYQDMIVGYRVSKDYHHVAIDPPGSLAGRQLLYLRGNASNGFFRVDRYPDDTWHLSGADWDGTAASHIPLDAGTVDALQSFVQTYSSLARRTSGGLQVVLYGLGPRVQLSAEDQALLESLAGELAGMVW